MNSPLASSIWTQAGALAARFFLLTHTRTHTNSAHSMQREVTTPRRRANEPRRTPANPFFPLRLYLFSFLHFLRLIPSIYGYTLIWRPFCAGWMLHEAQNILAESIGVIINSNRSILFPIGLELPWNTSGETSHTHSTPRVEKEMKKKRRNPPSEKHFPCTPQRLKINSNEKSIFKEVYLSCLARAERTLKGSLNVSFPPQTLFST